MIWQWLLCALAYTVIAVGLYRALDFDPIDRVGVGMWCAVWPLFLGGLAGVAVIEVLDRGKKP